MSDFTVTMQVRADATADEVEKALRSTFPIRSHQSGASGFWVRHDGNEIHPAYAVTIDVTEAES